MVLKIFSIFLLFTFSCADAEPKNTATVLEYDDLKEEEAVDLAADLMENDNPYILSPETLGIDNPQSVNYLNQLMAQRLSLSHGLDIDELNDDDDALQNSDDELKEELKNNDDALQNDDKVFAATPSGQGGQKCSKFEATDSDQFMIDSQTLETNDKHFFQSIADTLNTTQTINANGGLFNPSSNNYNPWSRGRFKTIVKGIGVLTENGDCVTGHYTVRDITYSVKQKDSAIRKQAMRRIQKTSSSNLIFHSHNYHYYKKVLNSPVISGMLISIRNKKSGTVKVYGLLMFYSIDQDKQYSKFLEVYFGASTKNIIIKNNVAESGTIRIISDNGQGGQNAKQFNINSSLTAGEKEKLQKLNFFQLN